MGTIVTVPTIRSRLRIAGGQARMAETLREIALDTLGAGDPEELTPREWDELSEQLDQSLELTTRSTLETLEAELAALLRTAPRPLVAKLERMQRVADYGVD